MVLLPTSLLSLHRHCCTSYGAPLHFTQKPIFSIPDSFSVMAQDPSHLSQQEKDQQKEEAQAASTSSSNNNNNNKNESKSWLQLGIGTSSNVSTQEEEEEERRKVTELQLFTNPVSAAEQETAGQTTHIAPPVQMQRPFPFFPASTSSYSGEPGPSWGTQVDRVVILPPRPQIGVWFVLKASQNQRIEPWLPQIARSFLRIRDANMTVCMVMKYLVNKLNFQHESEVEVTCRGQRLHPAMTLQYVRDIIWCSGEAGQTDPSPSSTRNHLMTLEYSRST